MDDDRDRLSRALARQAEWCGRLGSPLYAHLLSNAARDAAAGGPMAAILAGHEDAPAGSALALRLMGAVHRLVLEGSLDALAAHYPSVGGDGDADGAWRDFRAAVAERSSDILPLLERVPQTNEVGRAAALVGGFLEVARRFALPLRILEIGASAGLNLRWDRFSYEARGESWGDPRSPVRLCSYDAPPAPPFDVQATVVERRGCDAHPVDATSDEGRLTLLSYVWPDQVARIRLLRNAIEVARMVPAIVDAAEASEWLSLRLAEPRPGVATVVYHSIVMQYVSEDQQEGITTALEAAGSAATPDAPVAWLRMEPGGAQAEVRLTTWPGGTEELLARSGYHGARVRWIGPHRSPSVP